ncbi:polysaccharide pyruvyl transferase family protein [Idiomarina loihiensis]|nr:polysaccharide pyruvyl transferase family protein [Idiomarina loihiensis]
MEFGNIGNYYIIEPFVREIKRVFPSSNIHTTFQMSDRFCEDEGVSILPMELYYGWTGDDLETAKKEVEIAEEYRKSGSINEATPYIEALVWADLVIDFSGDIWGDNADFLGADRFEVGLLKDRTAQLLGKKTVMLAGSPGPFGNSKLKKLAEDVYKSFDLVTNREPLSTRLLEKEGFDCSNTLTLACPAFLFEPAAKNKLQNVVDEIRTFSPGKEKPVVGFILCGWNFEEGPFDKWPRPDSDYEVFAEAVEFISEKLGARVCLMSHSNGFDVPPAPFKLKHGRDYPIAKQLQKVVEERGIAKDVIAIDGLYDTWETKAIVGSMDMLVSGRVHAAVAALSQHVPTVIIDYGHEPKAHKLKGFATVAGVEHYVVDPSSKGALKDGIQSCWINLEEYRLFLKSHMPNVRKQAKTHFDLLKSL